MIGTELDAVRVWNSADYSTVLIAVAVTVDPADAKAFANAHANGADWATASEDGETSLTLGLVTNSGLDLTFSTKPETKLLWAVRHALKDPVRTILAVFTDVDVLTKTVDELGHEPSALTHFEQETMYLGGFTISDQVLELGKSTS